MGKKLIDLHLHSVASDGSQTPTEDVQAGIDAGLLAMALTDHDTIDGVEEFMEAGKRLGMETIPGVEMSVRVDERDVHLVCLFFDIKDAGVHKMIADALKGRQDRNMRMVDKLASLGYNISRDDFKDMGEGTIARGHIATILQERHFPDKSVKEIVHTMLDVGQEGYVVKETPSPKLVCDTIHNAGGLVFVAHLNQIHPGNKAHTLEIFDKLVEAGVDGLEVRYCEYDEDWTNTCQGLADKYNLLCSGGSDFHGKMKPGLFLGSGYGSLEVPYEYLEKMKERLTT